MGPCRTLQESAAKKGKNDLQREVFKKFFELDPLCKNYMDIAKGYSDSRGVKVLNKIRLKMRQTREECLNAACEGLSADPTFRVKLAILRRFLREQKIPGHVPKPFWGRVDAFYADKRLILGNNFDSPAWRSYLKETLEIDEDKAPTPPLIVERPLFTTQPLVDSLRELAFLSKCRSSSYSDSATLVYEYGDVGDAMSCSESPDERERFNDVSKTPAYDGDWQPRQYNDVPPVQSAVDTGLYRRGEHTRKSTSGECMKIKSLLN